MSTLSADEFPIIEPLPRSQGKEPLSIESPRGFRWIVALCCAGLFLPIALGCSKDPRQRQAVEGKVTLRGEALDQGTIEFVPRDGQGSIASGAVIRDGLYQIAARKGLPPGEYVVRVFSGQPDPKLRPAASGEAPGPGSPPGIERIPANYNIRTTLSCEVRGDAPNKFDFDL